MRAYLSICLSLVLLNLTTGVGLAQADAMPPFERIKGLVGEWEGKSEWSGARSGGGPMNATYYLTGNGSAIVEDLSVGSDVIMTSVYHMDGDALRMTHFCGAGNQPRLRATSADGDVVSFELVDITNLAAAEAGHVHQSELHFKDENHIEVRFTFLGDGKESYESIELERVPAESL